MFSVAGRDGLLPTVSAYIHIERLTPVIPCIIEGILGNKNISIVIQGNKLLKSSINLGVLYVLVGDANVLLGYLSFSTWLVCLCSAISVLIFRRTMPNVPRPFNAGLVAPMVFIVVMSALTLVNIIFNPIDILVGVLILLSGLPIYWIFVLNRPTLINQFSRFIMKYLQQLLLIGPDTIKQND